MSLKTVHRQRLLLACLLILLLGAALRILGMSWGLPYQLHPDEPVLFINAWERWDTGHVTMMPDYPPLYPNLLAAQREFIYRVFGSETPQVVYFFFGRWNSVLLSLLILAVGYRVGRIMGGWRVGLAFMLFLAVEKVSVQDQGWIIKGDNLAWLLTLCAIGCSFWAYRRHSWLGLAGALVLSGAALIAKYNMGIVAAVPLFIGLHFLLKRTWLTFALTIILIIGGVILVRVGFKAARYELEDRFAYCSGYGREDLIIQGYDVSKSWENPPCSPYNAFIRFASNLYSRPKLWDDSTQGTLDYLVTELRNYFGPWTLAISGLLLAFVLISKPSPETWLALAVFTAVIICTVMVFALVGVRHPIRQFYFNVLALALVIALAVGRFGDWKPALYFPALGLLFLPYLLDDIAFRRDLFKPDTRAETAEYFLDNARSGETILMEYDKVEFSQQYGGFPEPDGYFNVMVVDGLFDEELETLADQGIYYAIADSRAYTDTAYLANQESWPSSFELARDLTGDEYLGPERLIFRTFRPQHIIDAKFGDVITLHGYDITREGDSIRLKLYWQADASPLPDYVLFIHPYQNGEALTGQDAPPERSTSQWEKHEWVFDERIIDGEADELQIGLYEAASGNRLPVNGDPTGILTLPVSAD
jgi:hypothetical protein